MKGKHQIAALLVEASAVGGTGLVGEGGAGGNTRLARAVGAVAEFKVDSPEVGESPGETIARRSTFEARRQVTEPYAFGGSFTERPPEAGVLGAESVDQRGLACEATLKGFDGNGALLFCAFLPL